MTTTCPICKSELKFKAEIKDYAVSKESFQIFECTSCQLLSTNVDHTKDLTRYYESSEYHSHVQTGQSLISKLYRIAKKITLSTKRNLVTQNTRAHNSILDIGCGTGDFLHTMQKNHWQIAGMEPSDKARKQAESKLSCPVAKDLSEITGRYNTITLWHVLEHIPDLPETIAKIKQLLEDDGTLIIAVPNHKSYDATFYKSWWAGYDVPRHIWHFSATSITNLTKEKGLKINQIKPMYFDSYYVSLLSERYKQNKLTFPGLIRALIIGSISNLLALFTGNYSSLIYFIKK